MIDDRKSRGQQQVLGIVLDQAECAECGAGRGAAARTGMPKRGIMGPAGCSAHDGRR
jgi:hypothetical protein